MQTLPERKIWKIQTSQQSLCTQCAEREAEGELPYGAARMGGAVEEVRVSSLGRLPRVDDAQGEFGRTSRMS